MFVFTFLLLPTYSHVVFKEIGTMAGSTSYIHITVNAGLQDIEDKVMEYTEAIFSYKALVNWTFKDVESSWKSKSPNVKFDDQRSQNMNLVGMFANEAGKLKSRIVSLRGTLPTLSRDARSERRPRGLKTTLINVGKKAVVGVFGTKLIKIATKGVL